MSNPLVSVVIPIVNGDRFLGATSESALAQTYRPVEVIAVDDRSTDSSEQILSEYIGRIRYLRQENADPGAMDRLHGPGRLRGPLQTRTTVAGLCLTGRPFDAMRSEESYEDTEERGHGDA